MRRTAVMMLALTTIAAACSSGSDAASETTVPPPAATQSSAPTVPVTAEAPTTTASTTTSTTAVTTTTIDEAAVLADAEAAYLDAFEVGKEVLRTPNDPKNESRIRRHFTGPNGETALEDLRRARDGNFVAKVNEENPTFATIIESAEFVDGDTTQARMTVCEFNSDRIFEVGTAPDGSDALRRDDPASYLIITRVRRTDDGWKSVSGNQIEEVKGEEEQCSNIS